MINISLQKVQTKIGSIIIYELINSRGAKVNLSSLGAGILSICVPDKMGNIEDVVLGYCDINDYVADGHCFGKTAGRYANRIAKGRFSIDGKEYSLNINNGPNHLHGGPDGFQNKIWTNKIIKDGIEFMLLSEDGDEHYPGNLTVSVIYKWTEENKLSIQYKAFTDRSTVLNLTNHTYFNLNGENSGTALNHRLKLHSSKYLPTDNTLIPSGEFDDVQGTPMDFRDFKELGKDINEDFTALKYGKGYDNCWMVDNWNKSELYHVATLVADKSGRVLEISTTQPGVQVYTGNWISDTPKNKQGGTYHDYDGVAIECQGLPDSPNHKNFPSQELHPGEVYEHEIVFSFSIGE